MNLATAIQLLGNLKHMRDQYNFTGFIIAGRKAMER